MDETRVAITHVKKDAWDTTCNGASLGGEQDPGGSGRQNAAMNNSPMKGAVRKT